MPWAWKKSSEKLAKNNPFIFLQFTLPSFSPLFFQQPPPQHRRELLHQPVSLLAIGISTTNLLPAPQEPSPTLMPSWATTTSTVLIQISGDNRDPCARWAPSSPSLPSCLHAGHEIIHTLCHNPIFDPFILIIIIILFTEKDKKNDDEKQVKWNKWRMN